MKIVFLGDSLVWGGYGGDFVAEVAELLPGHTVINEGYGGNTVLNLLGRLESVLAQEPDGIFVMVGGNDAISHSQPATRRYYEQVQKVPNGIVSPEQFTTAYRELLTQIQLAHVLTWVGLETTEYNPDVADAMRQYNQLARDVARSLNIPVFDLMEHLPPQNLPSRPPLDQKYINLIGQRSKAGWSDYEAERQRGGFIFTFDGLHITPETAQKVAALIVQFLDL
jgi:lysophospholipase L1-like esterase